jgi:hypothetical protein
VSDDKDNWQSRILPIALGWARHFKGGRYVIFATTIDEATGVQLVHYFSATKHTRWSRTRENFTEMIGDRCRFEWWRVATVEELAAAAFGGTDELTRVFGSKS